MGPNALVKPEIDVWNLGCIFSIAATWIILGPRHVKIYEQLRLDAVAQTLRRAASPLPKLPYFHDGNAPLPVILQWHRYLRSMVRPNDQISPRVLDVIEKDMLQEATTRASATKLRNTLERVLNFPYEKEVVQQPFVSKIEAAYARVALSEAGGSAESGPIDDLVESTLEAMSNTSTFAASPGFAGLGEDALVEHSSVYDEETGSNFASQRTSRRSDQSRVSERRPPSANAFSSRKALNLSAAGQEIAREIPDGLEPVVQEEDPPATETPAQNYEGRFGSRPQPLSLGQQQTGWNYHPSADDSVRTPTSRPEIPIRSPQRQSPPRQEGRPEIITPPPQPDIAPARIQQSLQRRLSQASSIRTFSGVCHPSISDLRPRYEVDKGLHGRAWHTVRAGINRSLPVRPAAEDTRDGVLKLHLGDDTEYELVVDDGPSGAEHWEQMIKVVETLATIFTVHDKARLGLSLAFGGRAIECSSTIDPKKFRKALEKGLKKVDADASMDVPRTLERLFVPYRSVLQGSNRRPRDLNVIVLTDGLWSAAQADETVVKLCGWVNELKVHYPGDANTEHFGVGLVQFGRDEQTRRNLEHLAYQVQAHSGWDVLDTVPSLGSAYRIILGATKRQMRVDMSPSDPPISPPLTSPSPSLRSESRAASVSGGVRSPGLAESVYGDSSVATGRRTSIMTTSSVNSKDGQWAIIRGGRTSRKIWVPAGQPMPHGAVPMKT
jgi:hypothetical protein